MINCFQDMLCMLGWHSEMTRHRYFYIKTLGIHFREYFLEFFSSCYGFGLASIYRILVFIKRLAYWIRVGYFTAINKSNIYLLILLRMFQPIRFRANWQPKVPAPKKRHFYYLIRSIFKSGIMRHFISFMLSSIALEAKLLLK